MGRRSGTSGLPVRGALLGAVALAALGLGGCESLFGPIPEGEEVPVPEAPAPADPLEAHLRERGRELAPYMILEEAAMRGELTEGQSQDFSRILHPGWCYKVIGVSDPALEDLDVRIYDPEQILLERDTTQEPEVYLGQMRPVCPTASGMFRVEIRAARGGGAFAVQLYRSI